MSVLGAIIERKREEVAARRAAEPDAALICYPREFSLRANILDVADQVIFIWCGLKGRAGARAEAAGPTRGFEDALRGPAPAASGPSAGIRGCGGIRAPLHPRPPRRAPSTIGSTRSPRSRSSRARRIGALGAAPDSWIHVPGERSRDVRIQDLVLLALRTAAIAAATDIAGRARIRRTAR
jgi:hypothetical protein